MVVVIEMIEAFDRSKNVKMKVIVQFYQNLSKDLTKV